MSALGRGRRAKAGPPVSLSKPLTYRQGLKLPAVGVTLPLKDTKTQPAASSFFFFVFAFLLFRAVPTAHGGSQAGIESAARPDLSPVFTQLSLMRRVVTQHTCEMKRTLLIQSYLARPLLSGSHELKAIFLVTLRYYLPLSLSLHFHEWCKTTRVKLSTTQPQSGSGTKLYWRHGLFFPFRAAPADMEVSQVRGQNGAASRRPTSATATLGPSHVRDLCCTLRQRRILNPLSEARNQTCILGDTMLGS